MLSNFALEGLNDQTLLSQFGDLVRQNHEGNAQLLRHIDVIDRRKLWAKLGHPTLFDFLIGRYHMSEATAFKRIGAARAARCFPVLYAMVARGEIHLSGIHRLKAHLTRENHEQVLALAKHKTMRQIDELVARLAPKPDVPTTLRALPQRNGGSKASIPAAPALAAPASASLVLAAPAAVEPNPIAVPSEPAGQSEPAAPSGGPAALPAVQSTPAPLSLRRDPDPAPLSPGRYRLQVTLNQSTRDKLKELQGLLAHQIPNGDPAAIIERALDALWTQVHKRKTGITAKPRAPKPMIDNKPMLDSKLNASSPRSRHVPAAERREVWPREDARCGFVGEDGHPCNDTRGLQFAHRKPWAKGGANVAENFGLRCRAHNALEADRDYGAGFMARKRNQKPLKVRERIAYYGLSRQRSADATSEASPPLRCSPHL